METKRPTLKIKISKGKATVSKDTSSFRNVQVAPELPGRLDITTATPSSIVAVVLAQGLGSLPEPCLPEWDTFFQSQADTSDLDTQPIGSSPSTQNHVDSNKKRKHIDAIDIHADATTGAAKHQHSSGLRTPPSPLTSHQDAKGERPSSKGSRSYNEGSTHNATHPDPTQKKRALPDSTHRNGQEACSTVDKAADNTNRKHLTVELNHSATHMRGSISPQLANHRHPVDSSPSPNQQHHSPLLTSTSSKPSQPLQYPTQPSTTDTHTQTAAAPTTQQSCQANLPTFDLLSQPLPSTRSCHPANILCQSFLSMPPQPHTDPKDWEDEHSKSFKSAVDLKHRADKQKAENNPHQWTLEGLLVYCLAGIRFLEAYEYLRLMHRSRTQPPKKQKPKQLLEQTIAFQQMTDNLVKKLYQDEVAASGQPPVALQALRLLCRRLVAISQAQLVLLQQQMLRDTSRVMRDALERRSAAATTPVKDGPQQPSPDVDSASSGTLSARDAAAGGKLANGVQQGSGSSGRDGQRTPPTGSEQAGLEKRLLGAVDVMLSGMDAWRSTTQELQGFIKRVAEEKLEGGQQVAMHIYMLGLDGGTGDVLHSVRLACGVVDSLYTLIGATKGSKAAATGKS